MCEKEMELQALREKISIVSKKRDELMQNNVELIKEKGKLHQIIAQAHLDVLALTRSKARLRREKNFWFWACMAMTATAVFSLVMWIGG